MKTPSPQFISKLEDELRLAYRAQHQGQNAAEVHKKGFGNIFKFIVPAFSGALVLGIVVLNNKGTLMDNGLDIAPIGQTSEVLLVEAEDERFVAFTEGAEEEQIVQNFDSEELDQIDNEVRSIAESNF